MEAEQELHEVPEQVTYRDVFVWLGCQQRSCSASEIYAVGLGRKFYMLCVVSIQYADNFW